MVLRYLMMRGVKTAESELLIYEDRRIHKESSAI